MTAPSITRFLLVRIAEDEAAARATMENVEYTCAAEDERRSVDRGYSCCDCGAGGAVGVGPDRVFAECAAKRKVVSAWSVCRGGDRVDDDWVEGRFDGLEFAIAALAAVYNTHPDYRQEWAL